MRKKLGALLLACAATIAGAADGHSTNSPVEADLRKFQLAPGWKINAVATEPLLQNPVAFSIDSHGRFFVAETHRYRNAIFDITANTPWLLDDLSFRTVNDRGAFLARAFSTNYSILTNDSELIRLVEDRDGDGHAETSSVFADGFRESVSGTAAGVLAHGTNVWFTSIPDLWRFTAGGRERDRLATGLGVHISVSGHDVHGLILGPDGRIYFSFGDRGVHVTNREGAVLDVPDTGGVLRCEPDGRALEVFCVGLRNPQELAFDDFGNLWTVDNDTAGADPCRVLHLVEGGDYGWRASYQHMKGFGPWVQEELWRGGLGDVLPTAGAVSQGPAGLAFHPGTGTTPLAGRFVHADFPGGIWAYDVKARGASFALGGKEKLLWNCWPTDVDFGPDGSLYVLDWVQGWTPPGKGRIYRMVPTNAAAAGNVAEVQQLLREGMTQRESDELGRLLGHADRRIRLEAHWALAARGTNSLPLLIRVAGEEKRTLPRLHALWAFRQILRRLPVNQGAAELAALLPLLEDKDAEIRGQAALALGEGMLFNAEKPMARLLQDPSPRTRRLAIEAHALRWAPELRTNAPRSQARSHFTARQTFAGTLANRVARAVGADQYKVASALGATVAGHFPAKDLNQLLSVHGSDPFILQAATHFLAVTRRNTAFESHFVNAPSIESAIALVRAQARAGQRSVGDFLTNAASRVVLEAARAINDTPVPAAYPALAALLRDPRFEVPDWSGNALTNITPAGPFSTNARAPREQMLRRALNAHYRLGSYENAAALAAFARDTRQAPALRVEALFLLSAWEILPARVGDLPIQPSKDPNHGSSPTVNPENWPGWFDRVVGLWRPLPPRSAEDARWGLAPLANALVRDQNMDVVLAALDAVVKLRLTNAAAPLAQMMQAATPATVRSRIPAALAVVGPNLLPDAVERSLNDPEPSVRAAALPYLDRLTSDRSTEVLGRILEHPPRSVSETRLAQAALVALGKAPAAQVDMLLSNAFSRLLEGKLPNTLELELISAAGQRSQTMNARLAQYTNSFSTTNPLASWRSVLAGGDTQRGRTVFFEKAEVQCSRCHQVKKEGGIVGPPLDGIGRLPREQLLEAIVLPNARMAAGYENVTLILKDGATAAGTVKRETAEMLALDSPEDGPRTIAKADVQERHRGLSAMPEGMASALSAYELRDLIEFLASLK